MYEIVKHQLTDDWKQIHTWIEGDTLNITEGVNSRTVDPLVSTPFLNTPELVAVHTGYKKEGNRFYSPPVQAFVIFVNGIRVGWEKLSSPQRATITTAYTIAKQAWWIGLPKKKWQPRITVADFIKKANDEIQAGYYGYDRAIAKIFGADYNASSSYIGFWTDYLEGVQNYEDALAILADAITTNIENANIDKDNIDNNWLLKQWSNRTWLRIVNEIWGGAIESLLMREMS